MKKFIFFGLILIIIAAAIYFVYTVFISRPPAYQLNYFVLNSHTINKNDLKINFDILFNDDDLNNYQLLFSNGSTTLTNKLQLKGVHKAYKQEYLKDSINHIFNVFRKKVNKQQVDPNQTIASMIELYLNNINKNNLNEYYFIAGSFPNCYKVSDANICISRIEKILSKDTTWKQIDIESRKKINWNITTNSEEPEQLIFNYLNHIGFIRIKDIVTAPKRICSYDNTIIITAFEPISDSKFDNFIKELKQKYGDEFSALLITQDNLNGKIFEFNSTNISDFKKYLTTIRTIKWDHLASLLEKTAELKIKYNYNNIVFFGNLPYSLGKKTIETYAYDSLKGGQYFWHFNDKNKLNIITKQFIEYFQKNYNVIIKYYMDR